MQFFPKRVVNNKISRLRFLLRSGAWPEHLDVSVQPSLRTKKSTVERLHSNELILMEDRDDWHPGKIDVIHFVVIVFGSFFLC
jgi:hypothetical protein